MLTLRRHLDGRVLWPAALALLAVAPAGAAAASRATPIPPGARAELLGEARRVGARDGDARPFDIEVVLTSFSLGAQATGDGGSKVMPAGTPVYLLAMRGHFTCNSCSHPRGAKIGPGTVIWLLRPVQRGPAVGFGFGTVYPDLDAAGSPIRLDRPAAHHRRAEPAL
jgi:hypothetical protein